MKMKELFQGEVEKIEGGIEKLITKHRMICVSGV